MFARSCNFNLFSRIKKKKTLPGIDNMKTVKINKEEILKIFEEEDHQIKILIKLYKLIYPNWNEISQVKGFPKTSKEVNLFLFDQFIQFDKKNHPNVLNGGLWMDKGFSSDENLQGWIVLPAEVELNKKKRCYQELIKKP